MAGNGKGGSQAHTLKWQIIEKQDCMQCDVSDTGIFQRDLTLNVLYCIVYLLQISTGVTG